MTKSGEDKAVPATVAYDPRANTVVVTPDDGIALGSKYTVTLSGATDTAGNVMTPTAWEFATADVAGCVKTLWRDSDTPAIAAAATSAAHELGVKFRADRDGFVTGIRFYKGSGNGGTHIGRLWSSRGEKLAEATFSNETATGWQRVTFSQPVRIAAGWTYVASYYAPVGRYSYNYDAFASLPLIRPPLTALRSGQDGLNGVYKTGAGFPNASYRATNYWVDPIFDTPASDGCQQTIWNDSQSPPTAATAGGPALEVGVKFRADRDGFIQGVRFYKGAGNSGTHVGRLWTRTGQKLAEATFVAESPSGWQQVWFAQPVAISAGTTYVASYHSPTGRYAYGEFGLSSAVTRGPLTALADGADGGNGVYAYGGGGFPTSSFHAGNYGVDVMFSMTSGINCPCSMWPPTGEPTVQASADTSGAELGVRFRTGRSGVIKGIRFYKGPGNTGTHLGRLWTDGGASLATATFTAESSAGWQEVRFGTPVAVTAGTTYVASYYAPVGRYAYDEFHFSFDNTTRGPLSGMGNGLVGANGVYRYGQGFPTSSYHGSNYWVDVLFETSAADGTAPVIVAQSPAANAPTVPVTDKVTARFSEPVSAASIAVRTAAGATVAGATTYDAGTRVATFRPTNPFAYSTAHDVTVSGARDGAGNTMAPVTWRFTSTVDPLAGPGGPIGLITSPTNTYSSYYAEIMRAEGLNAFTTVPLESLSAAALAPLDVAILGDVALTDAQVATLTTWVNGGGRLIAMSPDPKLASLLGISPAGTTLSNGYLAIDQSIPPGAGITSATMQYHGTADRYTLGGGTTMVARLYTTATASTTNPAVTMRNVGSGRAAAFTFDLARSIVLTRQGNPAWAGQERDGFAPIRSNDMFFGGSVPDWIDLSKAHIPQADEQQRLLVNLIEHLNSERKPLPRFWYMPFGHKAVVVPTGDDEEPGTHGSSGRFDRYLAQDAPGCRVEDWQCLRFTTYLWASVGFTDAQARAYHDQGFEVAMHPFNACTNFTPASLENDYATQLAGWAQKYVSMPMPTTSRYHCIAFSDWDSQPKTEYRHGIRFDVNYYYWPGSWIQNRPGFLTGSGIPMRFTDTGGRVIDVYQAGTVMSNESGQTYPFTSNTLLDRAIGATGYYGYFVANMHNSNEPTSFEDDSLVASAQSRGVPVVTSRDVLQFMDGRGASSFSNLNWSGNSLSFTIAAATTARGLTAHLPTAGVGGTTLATLTRGGAAVPFTTVTIKGIEYAQFPAVSGGYSAGYGAPAAALTAQPVSVAQADTATVSWTTSVPSNAEISYGTSPTELNRKVVGESARRHSMELTGLRPGTKYYYRVGSTDTRGRALAAPGPDRLATFTTTPVDDLPPVISNLKVTPLPDSTVRVTWRTDEPAASKVTYGVAPGRLDQVALDDAPTNFHTVVLSNLDASKAFHLRVVSADAAGNEGTFPAAGAAPTRFVTSPAGVADQTRVGFRTGKRTGSMTVNGSWLGELTLTGPNGAFESRVLDAKQNAGWQNAVWDADVPSGAQLKVSVRTGNTPTPDAGWSGWTAASGPNARVFVPNGRYLQYRVEMVASGSSAGAPVLRWIGFTHDRALPGADRRARTTAG